MKELRQIVLNIVLNHPQSVNHATLVKLILQSGYLHQGSLSADLMLIVQSLTKEGILYKNLETREIKVVSKVKAAS